MRIRATSMLLAVGLFAGCGKQATTDWRNRELPWRYGPQTGTASATHLTASGAKGPGPIAEGWQIALQDGRQITVQPYKLKEQHPSFGKVTMAIGLFDRDSQQIHTVVSPVIDKGAASFTLDIDEAQGKRIWDLVLWFRDA